MLRWMIFLASLVYLVDSFVMAQEVPMINADPKVDKVLDDDMFNFINKTLGAGKMGSHMKCTLKVRSSRELRKFSSGSQWLETLDVDFSSNGFDSGYKMHFKIPSNAKYGVQKKSNQWSGVGEEIKIELDDYYGHWIKFTHDGLGRIVEMILGNNLRVAPCEVR